MVQSAENIYYLAVFRKHLPTPVLNMLLPNSFQKDCHGRASIFLHPGQHSVLVCLFLLLYLHI